MIAKPIAAMTEADLCQLIEAGVPESKRIEYKRELPDGTDQGKVKFLKSVTAFANSQGGDVVFGMKATDGIPGQLVPLSIASADQTLQRLEQLCIGGVEPRLAGVQYRFVPLSEGGHVLVVRVAKSWNAPHRVTAGGHAHFYGRNAVGAYRLDVGELRRAFTLSEDLAERIRSFRANRLLLLGNGDGPVPLVNGVLVALHVIPLQSLASDIRVDVASNSQTLLSISPPAPGGWSQRLNLDGRVSYYQDRNGHVSSYALLFRSGIIEATQVYEPFDGKKLIPSRAYEEEIINALRLYLTALQELGVATPAYLFLSLLGVAGHRLGVNRMRTPGDDHLPDRDALILPEITIEEWSIDPAAALQPVFDMVWNAFGYQRSLNYDQGGQWVGQR